MRFFCLLFCTILGYVQVAAQSDCSSPGCLLFMEMSNETAGSTSGGINGDFPVVSPCFTAENAVIYSFEALNNGEVGVIIAPSAPLGADEFLQAGLFTATDACDASTFVTVDCSPPASQIQLFDLTADSATTYYVIVSGLSSITPPPAIDFTIQIAGSAVEPDPPFNVQPVYDIDLGQAAVITASEGASSYQWTVLEGEFGSIQAGGNTNSATVIPSDTTTYQLETILGGCPLTFQVIVNVKSNVFPASVITPNEDGINDVWNITNDNLFPIMDVRVFSRWGQQVYRSTGYGSATNQWDGTNNGSPLPAGTYYYVIDLLGDGNEETIVTGAVAIIY